MKDTEHVKCENDVLETHIFDAKYREDLPTIQFIVNIFKNGTATVKMFLPKYPAEPSLQWIKEAHPEEAKQMTDKINQFIRDKGAKITFYGY
jgi:hypothetical protein